ncbi:MAG: hypothetical protein J7621_05320 [Niastella sp.]|nr:hypothetical protein [Niastella sp.]
MLKRAKEYLSLPWVSVLCTLLAIAGEIGMIRIFMGIGSDKFAQVSMTHNFLQGHGLTLTSSTIEDLGKMLYLPHNGWPPGYNLFLSLFLPFVGDNYMLACFLVDCLSVVLFFGYCRKLLLLIKFPVWLTNLFLLFQGFFIVSNAGSTDHLSLTFLTASLYYLVKSIGSDTISWKTITPLLFFLLLACFTRYQNIPVAVCLAATLIATGLLQNKVSWSHSGVILLSCIMLFYGGFLLYQRFHMGSAYYLLPVKRGIYPGNLALMHPFVVSGFINLHFYAVQLGIIFNNEYHTWITAARWVGLPAIVLLTAALTYYAIRRKGKIDNSFTGFFIFGYIIYISTIGLLVYLALTHDKNIGPPLFTWTYVMDERYYIFPVFFTNICSWWYCFVRIPKNNTRWARWPILLFTLLTTVEVAHGIYYVVKKCSKGVTPLQDVPYKEPAEAFVIRFIKETQQRDPNRQVVITAFSKRHAFSAGLYGASGLFNPMELNNRLPRSSSNPAVLLLMIHKNELFLLEPFLRQPGVKLLATIKDYSAFTYYVEPAERNHP